MDTDNWRLVRISNGCLVHSEMAKGHGKWVPLIDLGPKEEEDLLLRGAGLDIVDTDVDALKLPNVSTDLPISGNVETQTQTLRLETEILKAKFYNAIRKAYESIPKIIINPNKVKWEFMQSYDVGYCQSNWIIELSPIRALHKAAHNAWRETIDAAQLNVPRIRTINL